MKKVLIPLAPGFEEIEAVTIIDILRRAGAEVVTAGLEKRNVTGSHGIHLVADSVIAEETGKNWDMVVLPGGVPGTPNLAADERLRELLAQHNRQGKLTAAVCAAPSVLDQAGVLPGRQVTIHPAWSARLKDGQYQASRVHRDANIITGCAAGAAMEFAFELVTALFGAEKAKEVNQGVLARL